jgi:hypothetical protein
MVPEISSGSTWECRGLLGGLRNSLGLSTFEEFTPPVNRRAGLFVSFRPMPASQDHT